MLDCCYRFSFPVLYICVVPTYNKLLQKHSLLLSINNFTKNPALHNGTRRIFHNTWGGSKWPFHPKNTSRGSKHDNKLRGTLDLLLEFFLDTSYRGLHDTLYHTMNMFLMKIKMKQQLVLAALNAKVFLEWPPGFTWWSNDSSPNICRGLG